MLASLYSMSSSVGSQGNKLWDFSFLNDQLIMNTGCNSRKRVADLFHVKNANLQQRQPFLHFIWKD